MVRRIAPTNNVTRSAVVALAATLLVAGCGIQRVSEPEAATDEVDFVAVPDSTEPPVETPPEPTNAASITMAPAADGVPHVDAAATVRQGLSASQTYAVGLARVSSAFDESSPSSEFVAGWIADLTHLERVLDADAIRALGTDPALERIAAPVENLDVSTRRVIALLDPDDGLPDYFGALVEVQVAVAQWQAAVPDMEAAWDDLVATWSAEWDQAVLDWEQAWDDATVQWEASWSLAVAEWEASWTQAAAEWEAEWEQAAAEWEQAWLDAAADLEQAWKDAAEEGE